MPKNFLTFIGLCNEKHITADGRKRVRGIYKCICGKIKIYQVHNVKYGNVLSCGCMTFSEVVNKLDGAEITTKFSHPLYQIWINIKNRCHNKKNDSYRFYGAKGCVMCQEWRMSYNRFFNWCIENGWKQGLEVDKDIKGNSLLYSPETCLIVTKEENTKRRVEQMAEKKANKK